MAIEPTDYIVVNRDSVDYKSLVSEINNVINDGAIVIKSGDGLSSTGVNDFSANQEDDRELILSVKVKDGIIVDGDGNIIIDPNFNLGTEEHGVGDGAIAFNAGDGLAEVGDNATANQTADTTKTFSVKTASGIIIDGGGNVIIDPNFNLDGNITAPGDGAININAGLGLEATGDNATANQTAATTRTLSAKTADGITIDGNGNIIIDPSFNLDGNITPPGDGKITINASDGSEVGTFTVNQSGPTTITLPEIEFPDSLHPSGFIDVSQPAPADPTHGDIYIQHRIDLADVVADASFVGIAGRTVEEAQFVMFGVDDLWHVGGNAMPTEVQSDWAETDASAASFIQNKPDLQSEVDTYAGDGAINVAAGPGLEATGDNATANQKTDTTRTLTVKTADGITIDANGNVIIDPSFNLDNNVNLPIVNDGTLTIKDSGGTTVGTFTANQAGNTDVTLPQGFSGSWNDLNDKPACFEPCPHKHDYADINDPPAINDGKLTIKNEDGDTFGEFTANQDGDTEVVIPNGLDCDGVAECLVNAPVDETKYAFAAPVYLNGFDNADKPPHPPEDHASRPYLYFEICDPDDHHMLELGEEGHGYCAGNKTIFRLPGTYVHHQGLEISIVASPPVYVDDRDAIYGFHPDDILVRDLKIFKGDYEKGVTTTEELWTGGKLDSDNTGKSVGSFKLVTKWNWWPGDEEYFFRVEFTCHRGDTYMYVFILSDVEVPPNIPGTTTHVNPEIPNITINPMEDN